jgi:CRP-like cAMP-binding protein/AmiR/NasT family two-component response regulator
MKKILLIEDERQLRLNTADILELSGYDVAVAENGKEGVEKALLHKPDLVICDIMMPVLDGYGVLQIFNRNPELAGIPFVFVTAKAERADIRRGMDMGADDYLTKPFGESELLTVIETRLRKVELVRQSAPETLRFSEFINQTQLQEGLNTLTAARKVHLIKKKKNVFSEGDDPMRLYYINSGKVRTIRENADGKELVTGLYTAGDFFGYISLIENTPYTDTALALEDSEIIYIPKDDFIDLLFKNASVAQYFIKTLAHNIVKKNEQLIGLAYNSLRKRVAQALIQYVRAFKKDNEDTIKIPLSREELATIAGTATESLIRTLGDFTSENLIEMSEGKIVIRDVKKLENLRW